jgi:polyisoprenoid-binding protein YceI
VLVLASLDVTSHSEPLALQAAEPADGEVAPGNVDVEESRIYVRVGKRRLGHEHGVEGLVKSGTIHLDQREGAGELVFDMASLSADTDAARKYVGLESTVDDDEKKDVTATMQGKGVLNTAEYPTATFTINSAALVVEKTDKGESQYQLDGELTLRDKTNALKVVAAAVEEKDGKVRLQGEFRIKQTDYGIQPYRAVGGLVAVADELRIFGDIWVAKE